MEIVSNGPSAESYKAHGLTPRGPEDVQRLIGEMVSHLHVVYMYHVVLTIVLLVETVSREGASRRPI